MAGLGLPAVEGDRSVQSPLFILCIAGTSCLPLRLSPERYLRPTDLPSSGGSRLIFVPIPYSLIPTAVQDNPFPKMRSL